VSDVFRHRSGTGKSYCRTRFDVGSERVNLMSQVHEQISVMTMYLQPITFDNLASIILWKYLKHFFFSSWVFMACSRLNFTFTFYVWKLNIFNIHGSVHRNNILIYKSQQNAQVTQFILSDNCSTCFGFRHHPSSEAQNNCNYSIWYPIHCNR
jgi:hypothetical protein